MPRSKTMAMMRGSLADGANLSLLIDEITLQLTPTISAKSF